MRFPLITPLTSETSCTDETEPRTLTGNDGCFNPAGFHVNSAVLQAVVSRYADAQYAIDFDSFVGCLIKMELLFSKCQLRRNTVIMSELKQSLHRQEPYLFCLSPCQKCLRPWKEATQGRLSWICNRCVGKRAKATDLSAVLIWKAGCVTVFPLTVAVPGDLLGSEDNTRKNPFQRQFT